MTLHGDLMEVLDGNVPLTVRPRLASVKILLDPGANNPDLYGAITAQSIARAEIVAPNRPRAICVAITALAIVATVARLLDQPSWTRSPSDATTSSAS
ncbi:hypothetical protein [Novosphingobium sp. M1R2S20]|uniref:Uncharacterized protein n=1 Tax=Novosphingobium rhizovicinum TaxID=3228928 RepID=A0ABV3RCD2_9SPHN